MTTKKIFTCVGWLVADVSLIAWNSLSPESGHGKKWLQ